MQYNETTYHSVYYSYICIINYRLNYQRILQKQINNMEQQFYTAEEIATQLQIHHQTLLRFIREKKIKAIKVGKEYRITPEQYADYLKKNTTA